MWDQLGTRTADEDYSGILEAVHAQGRFFGTDCPFDSEGGPQFIRETIAALDTLELSGTDRNAIYYGNAPKMLIPHNC